MRLAVTNAWDASVFLFQMKNKQNPLTLSCFYMERDVILFSLQSTLQIIAMMMPQKGDFIVKGKSGLCSFASKLTQINFHSETSVEIINYEHLQLS